MKDFTSIRSLAPGEIERLIEQACSYRDAIDATETFDRVLERRCVANLFFEPSTRTRLSFDLAAQRLGAHVLSFDPESSSTAKGESLRDTALTVASIGADMMVVRHCEEGAAQSVAEWTGIPVVNAGDGMNEHPTQALVDLVTITRVFGNVSGRKVVVSGDLAHSRVANSLVPALVALGGEVVLAAPADWLPHHSEVRTTSELEPELDDADVVYLLRVQTERGGVISDSYVADFQLNSTRVARMKDAAIVMHPGPINRGVEIADDVADSPRSHVNEQVRNGVPTRMAVFNELAGSLR